MLDTSFAQELYHSYAKDMPIIDFHNHLSAKMIAENSSMNSITEMWLGGDHYKWRALRANGVTENFITGDANDYEKFKKWAETIPYTMRNPLYHWTHLELKRYFNINSLLSPSTCRDIYEECNNQINSGKFGARDLLDKMSVEVVCTTDDPCDSLEYHIKANAISGLKTLPTWRPDRVVAIDNLKTFNEYIDLLTQTSNIEITTFADLLKALEVRQQHFINVGCVASDHGVDTFYAEDYSTNEIESIFSKARSMSELTESDIKKYKSAILYSLALMNKRAGWVQQFHIGPLRNNCSRLFSQLGADIGCDSMNDKPIAEAMGRFFDSLDRDNMLTKTIVYNLNPKDTEVIMSMCYNFNDGREAGKMQYGSAWWFLDQKDGMTKQIEALSSMGLLSRFVGMLTDSRSFLSFTRHEYFRRLLCNIIGDDLNKGLLPVTEINHIGKMVSDICYNNAKQYFGV